MAISMEELRVLKAAEEISDAIWSKVVAWSEFPRDALGKQFTRAADSIGANIAESFGCLHFGQKIEFLYYSRGSLFETKYWLNRVAQRNLMAPETVQELNNQLTEVARQLNTFANNLKLQQVERARPKTVREQAIDYGTELAVDDLFDESDFSFLQSQISNY